MTKRTYDTFTLGPLNLDVQVPYSPRTKEYTHLVDSIKLKLGGGAIITTMALATLRRSTAIAGSIGDDSAGDMIENELENAGVKTFLKRYPVSTAMSVITLYPDGGKAIVANVKSNKYYTPDDVKEIYPYVAESKTLLKPGVPWHHR